jgi:phosphopantothenoylcysteine decarboxylase / phosphopantothenate---cysteine ligase
MGLEGRKVVVGVTASIAAYKACEVVRRLVGEGAEVRVILTDNARKLIGPTIFRVFSRAPVASAEFGEPTGDELQHISLSDWADLILVAPATANTLGKVAGGIADDLLSTTIMAARSRTLFAPAMNVRMWGNPVVQANVGKLAGLGYCFIGPVEGRLATGIVGAGRMAEPEAIVEAVRQALVGSDQGRGLRVVITAGPTREFIDAVRYLSNPSTGRMGYALAAAAQETGAEVVLVSGPTSLEPPAGVRTVMVTSAADMREAVLAEAEAADIVVGAAAVGDFTVTAAPGKLKRSGGAVRLELTPTADIMAELGQREGARVLIGFAAETEDGEANARRKLQEKKLDLVVLNDLTEPGAGFATETNRGTLIRPAGDPEHLPMMPKRDLARRIWREALELARQRKPRAGS